MSGGNSGEQAVQMWEVVGGKDRGIKVRKGKETSSVQYEVRLSTGARVKEVEVSGNRLHYQRISGDGPDFGWVSLKFEGRDLLRRLDPAEVVAVQQDAAPVPAEPEEKRYGENQVAYTYNEFMEFYPDDGAARWARAPAQASRILAEDVLAQLEIELARGPNGVGGGGYPSGPLLDANIDPPGDDEDCLAHDVKSWLAKARQWLLLLNPKATVPRHIRLPASAVQWDPAAAVLAVLTHLHFNPERDVREPGTVREGGEPNLVTVACSTSDRRRSFHPLLYENFARQTYEPRELVIVHTGEMPSEYLMERAEEDPRVVYRFFPVTAEAPGTPRLTDESQSSPWAAVLVPDEPSELTHWGPGDPWKYEILRDGWTKGLKRNIACCIARGSTIAHFDDGCLYAPDYLKTVVSKLPYSQGVRPAPLGALVLSHWYTMSVADQEFRDVDLKKPEPAWEQYGKNKRSAQTSDMYNHGFVYVYSRSAWEKQPFPDMETVGTQDSDFIAGLQRAGVPITIANGGAGGLAACGWHRDATNGAKDAPANINQSQVLNHFMYRGEEVPYTPKAFSSLMPLVKEVATGLLSRRESYLKELVKEHGSVYVCAHCNFAVAKSKKLEDPSKQMSTAMPAIDAYDMTMTYDKMRQKFDVGQFSAAGGAVAEGHWNEAPGGHAWLAGNVQRMAICRNCGWQLGWRQEPRGAPKECASPGCSMLSHSSAFNAWHRDYCCGKCKDQGAWNHGDNCEQKKMPLPKGPVSWALIMRHVRERQRPGEFVPKGDDKKDGKRHAETQHNASTSSVCPAGHHLRYFCTGQGNGGAPPLFYICDICDRPARGAQHMWGCGTCDYDLCESCKSKRDRNKA